MEPVARQLLSYIEGLAPGAVFTPAQVTSMGGRAAVDQALSRAVKAGLIERLGRGVYHVPEHHQLVGQVPPAPEAIAHALAAAHGEALQVTELAAAHALGLVTQVPARTMYYVGRRIERPVLREFQVNLVSAGRRRLVGAGTAAGLVIQALRFLGPKRITPAVIAQIQSRLPARARASVLRYRARVPAWMRPHLEAIAGERPTGSRNG